MSSENARGQASVKGGLHTNHYPHQLSEKERKVLIYELERDRHDLWVDIIDACETETKRQILSTLEFNDGVALYSDLFDVVNRSERTIKKHIYDLDDSGIVDRSGNPTVVSFADKDVMLMVNDVLSRTEDL